MKRFLTLLLIAVLALSAAALTACSKGDTAETTVFDTVSIPDDLTPYNVNAEGRATGYYKNEYDAENRLTRSYTYDALGVLQGSTGYEYDENGNISRDIIYNAEDKILSQTIYKKTADDRILTLTELDATGAVKRVVEHTYTESGLEAEVIESDGSGNTTRRQVFEYDENDDLSTYTLYNGENVEYTITYVTAEDGTVTEYKYDGDGNLISSE